MNQISASPLKIAVLISGSGTNLQKLIDKVHLTDVSGEVVSVISNNHDAYGLSRAEKAGIATTVVDHRDYNDRDQFGEALYCAVKASKAELVVLAGFMRILSDDFVNKLSGKLINIHPSFLPDYKGLNTHQRVLDAGEAWHGVTVHFVTQELDGGPLLLQALIPVHKNDTADSLEAVIHQHEYQIYPEVVKWFVEGRVQLKKSGEVALDGQTLPKQGLQCFHAR